MDRIVTLKARQAAEAERRLRAINDLRSALASYAREHGRRFLLFGSAARGTPIATWTYSPSFLSWRQMTPGILPNEHVGPQARPGHNAKILVQG
jgi:hypothetical protein